MDWNDIIGSGDENEEHEKKKKLMTGLAGISDAMNGGHSWGEYFTGNFAPKQESLQDKFQKQYDANDPMKKKAAQAELLAKYQAYKSGQLGLEKSQLDMDRTKNELDPNSNESISMTKALRAHGIKIPDGMSASQIRGAYGNAADYAIKSFENKFVSSEKEKDRSNELRKEGLKIEKDRAAGLSASETELRKEVLGSPVTKATQELQSAHDKIVEVSKTPSAAGDMSLVFAYMKMLDPSSTVREGEQASARQAAGVPEKVLNIYNRLVTGESLAPEQRNDFVKQARRIYNSQVKQQQSINKQYEDLAKRKGIDPINVNLVNPQLVEELKSDEKQVGGVVYQRGSDGLWRPKK